MRMVALLSMPVVPVLAASNEPVIALHPPIIPNIVWLTGTPRTCSTLVLPNSSAVQTLLSSAEFFPAQEAEVTN